MNKRLLTALTATTLLAAPAASAPAQGAAPTPGCHGVQITDKAGDNQTSLAVQQTGSPSSDLVAGWINYDAAANKATANIQVDNLTEGQVDAPYVAVSWSMSMTTTEGPRFVRAYHDRLRMTNYTWGEPRAITDDQTAPRVGGTTTGALFPGKNGVIQIDIPLADMGAKPGSQLKALGLEVRQWLSFPAAVPRTGLPIFSVAPIFDEASGKGAFTLGPCPDTAPPGAPNGPAAPAPVEPAPGDPSSPGQSGFDVKVTVPKLSAKKLKKSKSFTIKLDGKASDLVAVVRKKASGGKNLAAGKLASLDGSGRMKLKTKGKLKKGTYFLLFSGKNAEGQQSEGAIRFKVKK